MLVEEESITDTDLSEGLGPADFRPDTCTLTTLGWQSHPVVPIRSGPGKDNSVGSELWTSSCVQWGLEFRTHSKSERFNSWNSSHFVFYHLKTERFVPFLNGFGQNGRHLVLFSSHHLKQNHSTSEQLLTIRNPNVFGIRAPTVLKWLKVVKPLNGPLFSEIQITG